MKNSIATIFKKEMARFFGDKRLAFVTIILPGLLIFVLYSVMGLLIGMMTSVDENYDYEIYAVNVPAEIRQAFESDGIRYSDAGEDDVESLIERVKNAEIDALAVFPSDFEENMGAEDAVPNVKIYYNSEKTQSATAFDMLKSALDEYEAKKNNLFDVNAGGEIYDFGDSGSVIGKVLSGVLPMLLMIMLFTGALSVTPESIAGEKERGTIAALLVTPAKRSGIAVGKILALSIIALLSGLFTMLGVMLSVPQLFGSAFEALGVGLNYGFTDYLMLGVLIMSTVLMVVAAMSIVSAYARTVKEANSWSSPLMFILMGFSLFNMFEFPSARVMYLIPFFNSSQCMGAIFAFNLDYINFFITVAVNLVYTALGVWGLAKMFGSEKVVFGK